MERKKKKCRDCGELAFIWAHKRCKRCDALFKAKSRSEGTKIGNRTMYSFDKYKKRKEIKAVSDKRAKELKEYRKLRDEYLKIHTTCEARVDSVCSGGPVELHHLKPRAYHLCDTDVFCAVCRRCHEWIERNDAEARKLNLKLDHL